MVHRRVNFSHGMYVLERIVVAVEDQFAEMMTSWKNKNEKMDNWANEEM